MIEARKPRFYYGYVIVIASFFIMTIGMGARANFGVFFEPLIKQFGWTRTAISATMSINSVIGGACGIISGRLTDRLGPRVVITLGCGIVGLGYLCLSRIEAIWQLYLIYSFMAVGASTVLIPLTATVGRWFVKRRGLMTGIVLSFIGVGMMSMPPLSNWLVATYGWRTAYFILGIIVLVVVISAAQFLKRDPGKMVRSPDNGQEFDEAEPVPSTDGFSFQEAIRTNQIWMILIFQVFLGISLSVVETHIVVHAVGLGVSAASAAVILTCVGTGDGIGLLFMATASDKFDKRLITAVGFVLISAAFFLVIGAREVWVLYLFGFLFGLGHGSVAGPQPPFIAQLYGLRAYGALLGTTMFGATIGNMVGPVMAGYIFDTTGDYRIAFIILAIINAAGIVMTWLLKPRVSLKGRSNSPS